MVNFKHLIKARDNVGILGAEASLGENRHGAWEGAAFAFRMETCQPCGGSNPDIISITEQGAEDAILTGESFPFSEGVQQLAVPSGQAQGRAQPQNTARITGQGVDLDPAQAPACAHLIHDFQGLITKGYFRGAQGPAIGDPHCAARCGRYTAHLGVHQSIGSGEPSPAAIFQYRKAFGSTHPDPPLRVLHDGPNVFLG